ncbi:MAG: hypothetical protein PGN21_06490 [Sphingomonas paucimobilis]
MKREFALVTKERDPPETAAHFARDTKCDTRSLLQKTIDHRVARGLRQSRPRLTATAKRFDDRENPLSFTSPLP